MEHRQIFGIRWRTGWHVLILFLWLLLPGIGISQQISYPAMVALNRHTGFIMDSLELQHSGLFLFIPKSGIDYLVLIQTDADNYQVNSIYRDDARKIFRCNTETVKKEWKKLPHAFSDTGTVADFENAQAEFPRMASFVVMDTSFTPNTYHVIGKYDVNKPRFFVNTGFTYSTILNNTEIVSFHLNAHLVVKRVLVSLYVQSGSDDTGMEFFDDLEDYKYRETGITGGYVFTKNYIFTAVSAGIAGVSIQEILFEYTGNWFQTEEVSHKKMKSLGFPVSLEVSLPSASVIGVSLSTHATFMFDRKPSYSFGIGIRLGRTSAKRIKEIDNF